MTITADTVLPDVARAVCTALDSVGVKAVLTEQSLRALGYEKEREQSADRYAEFARRVPGVP